MLYRVKKLLQRLSGRSMPPEWRQYQRVIDGFAGLRAALFLSFDCDTDEDAQAALTLAAFLSEKGIKASFAVPGTQLLRNREAYQDIAAQNFEFINHGFLPHTEWDGEKYIAKTFYNDMRREQVAEDIHKADAAIREVIGRPTKGFRAPHFGSFQKPDEVAFMHEVCAGLGYAYASTTLPSYAFERGPAFFSHGLVELPVIGSWSAPHVILDSWNYLEDRVRYRLSETYYTLFSETIEMAERHKLPMLFCWYADPSHVINQPPFLKAMELVAAKGLVSFTGSECAACWAERLRETACAV